MATQNNTWQDWILYWGAWRGGGGKKCEKEHYWMNSQNWDTNDRLYFIYRQHIFRYYIEICLNIYMCVCINIPQMIQKK